MCGIVGFTGARQAGPILLEGLRRLEYRGYDSAGVAVQDDGGQIRAVKASGRLEHLCTMTREGRPSPAPVASDIPAGPLTGRLPQ